MSMGIIAALPQECRCLKKVNASVLCSGVGAERAAWAANQLVKAGSDRLVSWGFAGGLDPTLKPGTLLLPKQIQSEILNLDLESTSKMLLIENCGEIELRLTEGSDEFIQLEALLSQFTLYGSK